MKHLILQNHRVYQSDEMPPSLKGKSSYGENDYSVPYLDPESFEPKKAALRFLILTISDAADPAGCVKKKSTRSRVTSGTASGEPPAATSDNHSDAVSDSMQKIWDYAVSNGIRDIYVLPADYIVREEYGSIVSFLSLLPEREDIRLHMCLTSGDYNSIRIRDFQELYQTRNITFSQNADEAVEKGSELYILPDGLFLNPEEQEEMNRLEHPPSRLKGSRLWRYENLLYEGIDRVNLYCEDVILAKHLFLKGWNNRLMLVDDMIFLPANDCVDVYLED